VLTDDKELFYTKNYFFMRFCNVIAQCISRNTQLKEKCFVI